jgi:hypothetical protein
MVEKTPATGHMKVHLHQVISNSRGAAVNMQVRKSVLQYTNTCKLFCNGSVVKVIFVLQNPQL